MLEVEHDDDALIVRVTGPVDSSRLARMIESLHGEGRPVILDLSQLALVDQAMIRVMAMTAEQAIRATHAWFEVNSGWASPDEDTLAEWLADGVCRCPDECLVAPDAWCEHGLASWSLVLGAMRDGG